MSTSYYMYWCVKSKIQNAILLCQILKWLYPLGFLRHQPNPWPVIVYLQSQTTCYLSVMFCIHFTGTQPSVNRLLKGTTTRSIIAHLQHALPDCRSPTIGLRFLLRGAKSNHPRCEGESGMKRSGGFFFLFFSSCDCAGHCDLQCGCLQLSPCAIRAFPWECGLLLRTPGIASGVLLVRLMWAKQRGNKEHGNLQIIAELKTYCSLGGAH